MREWDQSRRRYLRSLTGAPLASCGIAVELADILGEPPIRFCARCVWLHVAGDG
jgi:hypothetical protein